jgi:protein-S-isoprenylcysteine O-methyltransferase Ste14
MVGQDMMVIVGTSILLAYCSLLVELTVMRVPSVASSASIWSPKDSVLAHHSSRYRRIFFLSKPRKLLLFLPMPVIYAAFCFPIFTLIVGPDPIGDYLFDPTSVSVGLGILAIVVGRSISFVYLTSMRQPDSHTVDAPHLRTGGPFRWSRNPGLVGMYIFVVGVWLMVPSAAMLSGMVVYVLYMDFKVRIEEDFLQHAFGNRYVDYRAKTGRYIR